MGEELEETEGVPICLNCAAPLAKGENFCKKCGAPASFAAMSMPYESVLARGFAARQASTKPRKLIVVIGMWVWMAPMFLIFSIGFLGTLYDACGVVWQANPIRATLGHLAVLAVCGGLATIAGTLIYKTTRNYVNRPRHDNEDGVQQDDPEVD